MRIKKFYFKWINKNKFKIRRILNMKKHYYSSLITRFYMAFKDKNSVPKYIRKLKKIWDKKDVLIIEGEHTRFGVGNDLLNNTKSIKRLICPTLNAFKVYNKIIAETISIQKKNLILISLGPTATILTYDLHRLGYQVIDVGHMDLEYEWFLRNVSAIIKIENKYVNEVNGGRSNIEPVKEKSYYNQIIKKINE